MRAFSKTHCAEAKYNPESPFSQDPLSGRLVPSGVPQLEAREEGDRHFSYKRVFIPPKGQTEEDRLLSRFIELYWDRISSSVFGGQETLEQDLENLRLQCEKEMQALDEKIKNNLRLKLVKDCGPLFLKSLNDIALKNQAALAVLTQTALEEKDKYRCLEALKTLDAAETRALLAILENWIPLYIESNLAFCKYILNTLEDKTLIKSLMLRCFQKTLYIGKYESLLQVIADPLLKNDICFELLALPQLNSKARQTFLGYIQPQDPEDRDRMDSCVEAFILQHLHLFEPVLEDFLPFIGDESLKACLILRFLSKRPLRKNSSKLIKNEIKVPCLRYWLCLVLDAAALQEAKALSSLQEELGVNLCEFFPKIDDYRQANTFIRRFLRYALDIQIEQSKIEAAVTGFLHSLEACIREEILYGICLDIKVDQPLRAFAARQIEDPLLRERYLSDIQDNLDRKRLSTLKLACPKV